MIFHPLIIQKIFIDLLLLIIMNLFNLLPIEIEDIIWNLYWQDIYSSKVINHFKKIKKICHELNLMIKNHSSL